MSELAWNRNCQSFGTMQMKKNIVRSYTVAIILRISGKTNKVQVQYYTYLVKKRYISKIIDITCCC